MGTLVSEITRRIHSNNSAQSFELPPALAGEIKIGIVGNGFSQKSKTFWLKPI
jgi:hypothetical protein